MTTAAAGLFYFFAGMFACLALIFAGKCFRKPAIEAGIFAVLALAGAILITVLR